MVAHAEGYAHKWICFSISVIQSDIASRSPMMFGGGISSSLLFLFCLISAARTAKSLLHLVWIGLLRSYINNKGMK